MWNLHKQPADCIIDHEYSIWLDDDIVLLVNAPYVDGDSVLQRIVDLLNAHLPQTSAQCDDAKTTG